MYSNEIIQMKTGGDLTTTSTTTTTTTTVPELTTAIEQETTSAPTCVDGWTEWFNGSSPTDGGGDFELYESIAARVEYILDTLTH